MINTEIHRIYLSYEEKYVLILLTSVDDFILKTLTFINNLTYYKDLDYYFSVSSVRIIT